MLRINPRADYDYLVYKDETGIDQRIEIGTPAWFEWLEGATKFVFKADAGEFSARRERRRNSWFWYGYKKVSGKLRTIYIGRTSELTLQRLKQVSQKLFGRLEREGINITVLHNIRNGDSVGSKRLSAHRSARRGLKSMFESCTVKARRVLFFARYEA